MENYIKKYETFDTQVVYDFKLGYGGIGDYIKFFMFILEDCIKNNVRLYFKKNNIVIENYIKLKYDMYINECMIDKLNVKIVDPMMYYSTINYNYSININEVFYFTDEIKMNSRYLFPQDTPYISIHLRLGDKYLETDKNYINVKNDTRDFSQQKIDDFIETNHNKNIFFCCDNNTYKLNLKQKYNNIIITNCNIGHTSLSNTTLTQTLDAITEFYILTQSEMIFAASTSGFSIVASKFNNIPLIN